MESVELYNPDRHGHVQDEHTSRSTAADASESIRVAYVTLYDANDITMMSGTGYHIARSLEAQGCALQYIGPLKRQYHPVNIARYLWNRYVRCTNDHPQRDPAFLRYYARQVERELAQGDAQVVLGSGGLPLAYLETDLPIVVWTDCTFATLLNYYPKFSNLSARTVRNGHAADRNLYRRCSRAIFPSRWAADSAIHDYNFPPDRVTIVSRGANVPDELSDAEVERFIEARPHDRCRLLFIGVDWFRKGGDIALEVAEILNKRGLPTELLVVGAEPVTDDPLPDFIQPLGRIAKSTEAGMRRFVELLGQSHFVIVPSRAEAYGIVFCEAAAYGVPSLATRTGGIPWSVREGVTGHLFDLNAPAEHYADTIADLFQDHQAYQRLALGALHDHRQRTTWKVAGAAARRVLEQAIHDGPRRQTRARLAIE